MQDKRNISSVAAKLSLGRHINKVTFCVCAYFGCRTFPVRSFKDFADHQRVEELAGVDLSIPPFEL